MRVDDVARTLCAAVPRPPRPRPPRPMYGIGIIIGIIMPPLHRACHILLATSPDASQRKKQGIRVSWTTWKGNSNICLPPHVI